MKKLSAIFLILMLVFCCVSCKKNNKTQTLSSGITMGETENTITENEGDQTASADDSSSNSTSASANSTSSSSKNNATSSEGKTSSKGSNSDKTTSNKPVSRPTVSRPSVTIDEKENLDASAPEVQEEGVNKSWSLYIAPEGLRDTQYVDAYSTGLSIRQIANGKMVASYAMIGFCEVPVDGATEEEQKAIAESVTKDAEYYYDSVDQKGMYFSWRSKGVTSHGKKWTFDEVIEEYGDIIVDDDGMIRLPGEVFGQRVIYQGQYIPCKYDSKSGKLEIDGKFPFKNFYIEGKVGENKYKIDGKTYSF